MTNKANDINSTSVNIIKSKQPDVGKYIIDSKNGIGVINKTDSFYYYVHFKDLTPEIKVKYSVDKIKTLYDTYYDAKEVFGYYFRELNMKVNDYFEINNKQYKIKTITPFNIILSDGTLISINEYKFTLINKINTTCVYGIKNN